MVVNPFKPLDHSLPIMEKYKDKKRGQVPAHIFTLLDESFQKMIKRKTNQSFVMQYVFEFFFLNWK